MRELELDGFVLRVRQRRGGEQDGKSGRGCKAARDAAIRP
jgi:hypothetical protein